MSDLVAGEFRGYRAWRLHGLDSDRLQALSTDHPWESATLNATCHSIWLPPQLAHPAPFTGCSCGLYAYYRASTVPPTPGTVFGVVAVAGRVILATRGMKAERMTILALATDNVALGERYGVPIYPSREALLSDYPPQDYSALVDVDPSDAPDGFPWGRVASGGLIGSLANTPWSAASMARASGRMAQLGVTAQQAGDALAKWSDVLAGWRAAWDQAESPPLRTRTEIMADALDRQRNRHTGPPVGRFRRDGTR